jgi:hypothetical protein
MDGQEDGKDHIETLHGSAKSHQTPSGEEVTQIRDAANLYRSASFKLQVRALRPFRTNCLNDDIRIIARLMHYYLRSAPKHPMSQPSSASSLHSILFSLHSLQCPQPTLFRHRKLCPTMPVTRIKERPKRQTNCPRRAPCISRIHNHILHETQNGMYRSNPLMRLASSLSEVGWTVFPSDV